MLTLYHLRRRRSAALVLFGLITFVYLCFLNLNSLDGNSESFGVQTFRHFFGKLLEQGLSSDFYRLPADDETLVKTVRTKFIRPPSPREYNFSQSELEDFSRGQSKVVDKLLATKEKSYYVDVGAGDGENESVTLFFERERKWRGLLVEPNPKRYNKLLQKHRKAHSINACVRTDIEKYYRPDKSMESEAYFMGKSREDSKMVPCFWLMTLLLATGEKVIDLLSIDLHGQEMAVLRSIDFDKIKLRIIKIEIPMSYSSSTLQALIGYLNSKGFLAIHQFTDHIHHKKDMIFRNREE